MSPARALAQAWRGGTRRARLARVIRAAGVQVVALDEPLARAAGVLCGKAGTCEVVDASVVLCARVHGHSTVVTSDPGDLGALDPSLRLMVV